MKKSKDSLGAVIRKLVKLPPEMLADINSLSSIMLSDSNNEWHYELKRFVRKQPCWGKRWVDEVFDPVSFWQKFYYRHFQKNYDFSTVIISSNPKEEESGEKWRLDRIFEDRQLFQWGLLMVANGITCEQIYLRCKQLFPCELRNMLNRESFRPKDLNKMINERDARKQHYAIWVMSAREAGEGLSSNSAETLTDYYVLDTITLIERLILELVYFEEMGQHLDLQVETQCSGSRFQSYERKENFAVPSVCWRDDKLVIDMHFQEYNGEKLLTRLVE